MSVNGDEQDGLRRPRKGVAMDLTYTGVPTSDYDNGRDEKPWQRLPSTYLLLLLGGYLLLGYLTQLVEDDMPSVVNDTDVARDVHDTFSEESARRYLQSILGTEPRVSGTPYHLNKTRDMKAIVDSIAVQANQVVRTDWQIVTGDYYLETAAPFVNIYEDASNIIVLLEGDSGYLSNGTLGSSILVNCHYDSVPYAMGASDNAVFCAVMAETLYRFSRRTRKFKHNIVFLFNGAEENGLQASHAFLRHEWSRGVRTVINLDAAGMNGKPAVFQVTDPRILGAYRRAVPRPNAQGLGEFLFSSGIIPSDTDFRIFRDFGDMQGIDIAFSKWGHVYHTRNDREEFIRTGVIQNAGNLLMGLLTELGDMEELATKQAPSTAVYYDYLNVFLITYSIPASYAVDAAILVIAFASVGYYIWLVGPRMSIVLELLLAVLSRLACVCAGVLLATICAGLTILTTAQLRYLSEPWIVVPLFWIPYLIGAVATSQAFDAWRVKKSGLNRSIRTLQAQTATRLSLAVALAIMMCIPPLVSTRYILTVPLFLMSAMSLVSLTAVRYIRLEAWQHLWLEVSLSLPTIMFTLSLALRLDAMLLPIMGRSPVGSPDVTVAVMNVGLAILVSCTVSGMELLFSRQRLWLPLATVGAVCFVLFFIPFAPYRDDGPSTMRHYWFHSEIVTFNQNNVPTETTTGVVVNKLDVNTIRHVPTALTAGGVTLTAAVSQHCTDRVYCDLPLYRTTYARMLPEAILLSTAGPAPFSPRPSLTTSRSCAGEACTYRFVMTGPAHNTLTIWPVPSVNVTSWSLSAAPRAGHTLLSRPVYVLVHSRATYNETARPFEFTVTFNVPLAMQSTPIMQVSHHSHKIHHPEDFTDGYRRILSAAPRYYNVASSLSFRHNYLI